MKACPLLATIAVSALGLSTASAALVGYYPFETDADDYSGNGNHGTVFGGAVLEASTPAALAASTMSMHFDEQNATHVSINHGAGGLNLTNSLAFSVSMWVIGGPQGDNRVFSEGNTTNTNPLYNIGTQSGGTLSTVDFYRRLDGGAATNDHNQSSLNAFDNTWHHLAWVDVDGTVDVYVDGVKDSTQFTYTNSTLTVDTTTIGGILRNTGCCAFLGNIDDVSLWDRALTENEIGRLAAGVSPLEIPEPSAGLLAALSALGLTVASRRRPAA